MDFVSAWKIVSIGLTGIFGMLGLLTEYKDKVTGRVTKFGRIALAGIILSTLFGMAAQVQETSSRDEARLRAERDRLQSQQETLNITRNTALAVNQLERLVTPIGTPRILANFVLDCDSPNWEHFCRLVRQARDASNLPDNVVFEVGRHAPNLFDHWPWGDRTGIIFWIRVFKDSDIIEGILRGEPMFADHIDFSFVAIGSTQVAQGRLDVTISPASPRDINLSIVDAVASRINSRPSVVGLVDFAGATIMMDGIRVLNGPPLSDIFPVSVTIINPIGQQIRTPEGGFRRVSIPPRPNSPSRVVYTYRFPGTNPFER